ncbi:MAG TPA: class I tRNA ligase family protein, partial [Candidatus Dormibacteraeota bacterium]|nr:class I tRNA ligase family protein [Candidatus Dormibacteraeota bacterium]
QERLERYFAEHPDWVQPEHFRNEMLGFLRGGLEDFSISRAGAPWGIPFPIREDGSSAQLPDGSWDPAAGTVYVWFDALTNYITGAGFPDDLERFGHYWPADAHVIGKDINRLHTIVWPAMLMSAGLPLPRLVWVHGWLFVQGERMSKSRGNFLDPVDMVAALGADGARYCTMREAAFDRDSDVSWDTFMRRYNADLANDFGNLVNRTVTMAGRYLEGVRPGPRPRAASPLGDAWEALLPDFQARLEGFRFHEALATLWGFVSGANKTVDAEQPWALAKAAREGDAAAAARLRDVLGDLVEACRVLGLAAAPFMPGSAPRVLGQLGHAYPYGPDGNGGPLLLEELRWGAHADEPGSMGTPEPLFPRLDLDAGAA